MQCSTWTPIFGTSSNDGIANQIQHVSLKMTIYCTLENVINEPDTIGVSLFLCSMKDNIGQNFNPATGLVTLVPGFHFTTLQGQVIVNSKVIKVHKVKRLMLTNHGSALGVPSAKNQDGTDYRASWYLKTNKRIVNPYGDWRQLICPPDPSLNYFLLAFNDNSVVDLQSPKLQLNIVHNTKSIL